MAQNKPKYHKCKQAFCYACSETEFNGTGYCSKHRLTSQPSDQEMLTRWNTGAGLLHDRPFMEAPAAAGAEAV